MSLLRGVDVSAYQGSTVPVVDFVIVKATEGAAYTSSKFKPQWLAAGARKHRGAYHFARPEESSAASQAARFLSVVHPVPGESVWLDLEASDLSQAASNAWAKAWGDYVREHAPGVTSGVYMGSGYASNNTGKGLADHFDYWWYPQYPTAAAVAKWPTAVSPWLPSGVAATGWSKPHIWQFTDNWQGYDGNVTGLTLDQLAHASEPQPEDDEDMYAQAGGFPPPLKVGERHSYTCPKGAINIWGIWFDSPHRLHYRIAAHSSGGKGKVQEDLVVGGPNSTTDSWPKKATWNTSQTDVDAFSIELVKAEGPSADWDPTQPGADGRTVLPGWDASHTA